MMDPAIVDEVQARLTMVADAETVELLFAVESGSRAWGFPSPDSDYDCRFVYLRPVRDYLALEPKRDVIETPLSATLDVNGWDLAKALTLMVKGNAVIVEWLTSPIVYRERPGFRAEMLTLANVIVDREAIRRHYLHLAIGQQDRLDVQGGDYPLKKLFYILRPLMALAWLADRPREAIAPMHFPTLCEQTDLPNALRVAIDDLLRRKAETRELGRGPVPLPIRGFIAAGLRGQSREGPADPDRVERLAQAQAFFERCVLGSP